MYIMYSKKLFLRDWEFSGGSLFLGEDGAVWGGHFAPVSAQE